MKRVFSMLMLAMLLVTGLGFQAAPARAASLITLVDARFILGKSVVFVFQATGYKNKDVHDASIFVGSNFHHLGCQVNKHAKKIECVGRGSLTEYAGQTGIIHLAGQLFYVTMPDRFVPEIVATEPEQPGEPEEPEEPLVCEENQTTGAYVHFTYGEGEPETIFISGSSLEEVQQTAQNWMDDSEGYILSFEIVSELVCGDTPQ